MSHYMDTIKTWTECELSIQSRFSLKKMFFLAIFSLTLIIATHTVEIEQWTGEMVDVDNYDEKKLSGIMHLLHF
jgi:hypothetical protein